MIHPGVTMKASVGTKIVEVSLGKHRRKAHRQRMNAILSGGKEDPDRQRQTDMLRSLSLARRKARLRKHGSLLSLQAFLLPCSLLSESGSPPCKVLLPAYKWSYADPVP